MGRFTSSYFIFRVPSFDMSAFINVFMPNEQYNIFLNDSGKLISMLLVVFQQSLHIYYRVIFIFLNKLAALTWYNYSDLQQICNIFVVVWRINYFTQHVECELFLIYSGMVSSI
jgi:hypothetical protein